MNIRPKLRRRRTKFIIFFILGTLLCILTGLFTAAVFLIRDIPDPKRITERTVAQSTKIYDRTGKVILYEIHGEEKRTVVALSEIPRHVKLSTLAAEDAYFYTHTGLEWRGILRAFLKNLVGGNPFRGQGGSTITQQLIKNSLLGSEISIIRKLREQVLSVLLERKYSKDEILELYLNQIPYGSNAYGIEAAAQTYFAKPVNDLTLHEAATLAALPRAPTYYSPYGSHKDELVKRRDWILDRMEEFKFAEKAEVEAAKNIKLKFTAPRKSIRAPHFTLFVREYLNKKYGEEFVERGGLKVITSLDWNLQEIAEKTIKDGAERNEKLVKAYNAALVALHPKTGEILAMVGSRDYWTDPLPQGCNPGVNCKFDPHVNVATRARQPGSAFKPFVYATAFSKGYTPETVLFDVPTEFNPSCSSPGSTTTNLSAVDPETCYHPQNYDGKFRGPVNLRQSLAQSLNIPSAKLLYLAGIEDSIRTAKNFGITTLTDPERYGLSLVLGGAEVTLLEMTSAFGGFAAEGELHPKTAILRVENSKGVVLEEKKPEPAERILDIELARVITDILSDNEARVPVFSPQSSLYFPHREVAAKTGTTQDFRDAWVVGFTPSLVVGVWAGNSDNSSMHQSSVSIMVAGPVWHQFIEEALHNVTPENFTKPQPISAEKPILRGLYRSGEVVKIDKISGKLATEHTPPELIREVTVGKIKSILAYVDKHNPKGSPPTNPHDDPQFKNWQEGIERWLIQNSIVEPELPKEFDDLHTFEKRPKITLVVPDPLIDPVKNLREVVLDISSSFSLREVLLFANDELLSSKTAPFLENTIHLRLKESLLPGIYQLKITAYDAVGNTSVLEKEITVVE